MAGIKVMEGSSDCILSHEDEQQESYAKDTQGAKNTEAHETLDEMETEPREEDMNHQLQLIQRNPDGLKPDLNDPGSKPGLDGTLDNATTKGRQFSSKSQSCSLCGKMFHRVGDRKRHEASCLRSPHRCHFCRKCFSSEDEWYEHEKRHTDGPIYKCAVCGKTTINQRTWRQHMRLKHPAELKVQEETATVAKCQHCEKTFNGYRSLGDHMEKSHSEMLAKALSHHCQFCLRSFSSSFGLLTHQIAVHPKEKAEKEVNTQVVVKKRKKSQCDQCGKVMINMKHHSRMHSGERPYPCEVCKKPFASPQNLKQHMRTHTGEKPYKCRYCASSFTTSGSRIRHERIHTGDKPFDCQFCAKAFKSRAQLSVHLRSHTGETPYQCPVCDKKFCYKNTLDRHVKTHKKKT